jgi:hypothetical protein
MNRAIVSHYNEDLSWLDNIENKDSVLVVSKTIDNGKYIFQKENIGNESTAYLKYIVERWDEISNYDHHIFLHGHRNSWHQSYDADVICNKLFKYKGKYDFINFCDNNFYEIYPEKVVSSGDNSYTGDNKPYLILQEVWDILFKKFGPLPEYISFSVGAQFCVKSDNIIKNGKDFYENCLNWSISEDSANLDYKYGGQRSVYSSRIFEWLWHFIYTGKPDHTLQKFIF